MANENVNKVVYNGNTLIDLTSDTATADDVIAGKTFHLKSGAPATGNAGVVRYDQQQTLTTAQKSQARTNIGAGTSSFSGAYNDLTGKPSIPAQPTFVASFTLTSGGWNNKQYSLEATYPFASYDVDVSLSPSATETQVDAYASAKLTGSPNSNVITALGDTPTINLPVFLKVWAK